MGSCDKKFSATGKIGVCIISGAPHLSVEVGGLPTSTCKWFQAGVIVDTLVWAQEAALWPITAATATLRMPLWQLGG